MASSNADLKRRVNTLRNYIVSYRPGKAAPCHDQRIVLPNKLAIGIIDETGKAPDVVHAMSRALNIYGRPSRDDGKRQTSTEGQKEQLTTCISVITKYGANVSDVHDLAEKAKCIVLLVSPSRCIQRYQRWIELITSYTGRDPLCCVFSGSVSIDSAKQELKERSTIDIYEVPYHNDDFSDGERLQWLDLLHGCLCEADAVMLYSNPSLLKSCEQESKTGREAVEKHEEENKLLQRRIINLEQSLNEFRASCESLVSENARLRNTMKVEQERRRKSEIAMTENEKKAKHAMEMYKQRKLKLEEKLTSKELHIGTIAENLRKTKETARRQIERLQTEKEEITKKLESKQQRVGTLTVMLEENKRNEKTLKQQFEELKQGREQDKARGENEKRSLAAEMTKKLEFKQQHVDTLSEIVGEKERNESTLRQQVEELKKGRKGDRARFEKDKRSIELSWKKELEDTEQLMEQLERETCKLRTKIQLESEIRSAEQKKKADTHQWSFIPWMTSVKQANGDKLHSFMSGSSSSEDNLTGFLGMSDTLETGEDPPDDEFGDILRQIAHDLYDEAKIDSLGGQLGILHGDIQRALMTNMRFNRVTSDGTHHMLKQWRKGVSREDERMQLMKALQAAKLVNLANLYLREDTQIDAEYVNEDADDQQLSTIDETSQEQDKIKGHTGTQLLRGATASNDHTPRDGHVGDRASETREDLTDGSRSPHPDKSLKRSTENFDASEVTSEDVYSEVVNAGDDMTNVNSIQTSEQTSSHEMQVLPEDMSEIAPLVSSGEKPNEESTIFDNSHVGGFTTNEEDLISQLVLIDTFPHKIFILFLVKIIMDVHQKALTL